ncbi:MAG: hypothetical protein O2972_03045, partial [Cyanobacteria bacterium]|nr:hypothetical protein [Cyanobacteriota bacterium]
MQAIQTRTRFFADQRQHGLICLPNGKPERARLSCRHERIVVKGHPKLRLTSWFIALRRVMLNISSSGLFGHHCLP